MTERARENLTELLKRFMDAPAVEAAHKDIQAGERLLDAYAAPAPDAAVLAIIKTRMAASALRRHRIIRLVHGSVAAAAAVVVLALIGLLGPGSANRSTLSYVAIMPAVLWDSDDIVADDLDLAYFSSEIGLIEAQMQALDADESGVGGSDASDELEMELMAIQTEFWKG